MSAPRMPGQGEAAIELERALRCLWGAYVYLRDNNLSSVSGTSRLLNERNLNYLRSRLAEELDELAGVLAGTHRHVGIAEDVLLEGSQVCYWIYLMSLCLGTGYARLGPHRHILGGLRAQREPGLPAVPSPALAALADPRPPFSPASQLAERLHGAARTTREVPESYLLPVLQNGLRLVGLCCLAFGVDVREIVRHDLDQMKERSYMRPYFQC